MRRTINRRSFCVLSAALALGAGSLFFRPNNTVTDYSSFRALAQEGLPSRFVAQGFKLGKYTNKGTAEEVLIIAENHRAPRLREREAEFIDFLIEKYHADSLGLEGLFGAAERNIEEKSKRDVEAYFASIASVDVNTDVNNYWSTTFRRYTMQKILPCYGVESREVLLENCAVKLFLNCVFGIRSLREKGVPYNVAQDLAVSERLFEGIRSSVVGPPWPTCSLEELTSSSKNFEIISLLLDYALELRSDKRTREFAKNITVQMTTNNSYRGICAVGYGHSIISQNAPTKQLLPVSSELPYSSLVVNVQ